MKRMVWRPLLAVISFLCLTQPIYAYAEDQMTLEGVFDLALKYSNLIKGVEESLQSLEAEVRSRDLELSAILSTEASLGHEKRINNNIDGSSESNPRTQGDFGSASAVLTKPFASGTELSLATEHILRDSNGQSRDENLADWEVSLSQSLWRNALGRAVDLRHQGEAYELKSRQFAFLLEKQRLLQNIEEAYWDLVLAHKEVEIRQGNLERSLLLEKWTRGRLSRFAAEEADLLQVEALTSSRRLDLTVAKNQIDKAANNLRQLIPNIDPTVWNLDLKSLTVDRELELLLPNRDKSISSSSPLKLEALVSLYRAKQLRLEAARIEDELLPDLKAFAAFGMEGADNGFLSSWIDTDTEYNNSAQAGLRLSVALDADLKEERRRFARLNADSQLSRARAAQHESEISWQEINRNLDNLKIQVKEARRLSDLQQRKVKAERMRFEQGRSTTFQITTFEVDAADSELRWNRLLSSLRKAESQVRGFARDSGLDK